MKSFLRLLVLASLALASVTAPLCGQTTDVLGMHNLTAGSGSLIYQQGTLGCTFCHAPHSGLGGITPLWNQQLSKASYTPYTSTTMVNIGSTQPTLGRSSSLCLSCHDGTVAVGTSPVYGNIPMKGSWSSSPDILGTVLTGTHPFSLKLPLVDSPDLAASLVAQHRTADTTHAVRLIAGNVQCTSCHTPHVQNIDRIAQNFLVKNSASGQICLSCHDPNRVVTSKVNPLAGWTSNIHATATNLVTSDLHVGAFSSVGVNACGSCHMSHNSVGTTRLLRPSTPSTPGYDPVTQDCISCHDGGTGTSTTGATTYLTPTIYNILAEITKVDGHPMPSGTNTHDAAEGVLLNNNRHATCTDCHSAHASLQTNTFTVPPTLRPSQTGVAGISATDGATIVNPAANQYENCLRCHGASTYTGTGSYKQRAVYGYIPIREVIYAANPLDVYPEFNKNATSSHPVMVPSASAYSQPSLLSSMLNIDGSTSTRTMGTQIFCTDCHNADDNREFGGKGPNGPHGSIYAHMLERNYQYSQAVTPGGAVTNTFLNPDLSITGPYAMCGKCHNLTNVLGNNSFSQHNLHVSTYGFSCSVCHTAHGMGATSGSVAGTRLVNFDTKVVGENNSAPIQYLQGSAGSDTCVLACHQYNHNSDGTVTAVSSAQKSKSSKK